jgi:hypothetical protein
VATFDVVSPEGDYIVRVVGLQTGISTGQQTRGATHWELKLLMEGAGNHLFDLLIDHEKTQRRLDTFLKCMAVELTVGQAYDFDPGAAASQGVPHINVIGRRGWARVIIDEYQGRKRNKIGFYYTDRPKLPGVQIEPQPVHRRNEHGSGLSKPTFSTPAPAADEDDIPF